MAKKYNRKNRAILSGIMVGLASIFAVASYFDVEWTELRGFMLSTLLFFAVIVLLAVLAILVLKGAGWLLARLRGPGQGDDSPRE